MVWHGMTCLQASGEGRLRTIGNPLDYAPPGQRPPSSGGRCHVATRRGRSRLLSRRKTPVCSGFMLEERLRMHDAEAGAAFLTRCRAVQTVSGPIPGSGLRISLE